MVAQDGICLGRVDAEFAEERKLASVENFAGGVVAGNYRGGEEVGVYDIAHVV